MARNREPKWRIAGVLAVLSLSTTGFPAAAQVGPVRPGTVVRPTTPEAVPDGQRIQAGDGDTIVVEGAGRVRIVRRREAVVRAIFNATDRWLVMLVDYVPADGGSVDGGVDATYSLTNVEGDWPLGERWEGVATIEDYAIAGEMVSSGFGLTVSGGLIQLLGPPRSQMFKDSTARAVLTYSGSGRGGGSSGRSFDAVEQREVENAQRNAQARANLPARAGAVSVQTQISTGIAVVAPGSSSGTDGPPVRVGGAVRTPAVVQQPAATYPEKARAAGVRGTVILEVTVGADGAVSNARVLRSIPLLDEAAVDAVRHWRYEPTLLNGRAVPVIMTVPVRFD